MRAGISAPNAKDVMSLNPIPKEYKGVQRVVDLDWPNTGITLSTIESIYMRC